MLVLVILTISTILQYVAALLALRLVRITEKIPAWILIASATCLMGVRRTITLVGILQGITSSPNDIVAEHVALVISILMVIGIGLIAPIFYRVKESERTLLTNDELYRATIESTVDGILVVNTEGKVMHSNQRFKKIWRIPQEILDRKESQVLLEYVLDQVVEPEEFRRKVEKLYASSDESLDMIYFKDGRIIERFSRPLLQNEMITGRVWNFRDVTEREWYEIEIKNTASTAMLYLDLMGHDIRNHLQTVMMAADIINYQEHSMETKLLFDMVIDAVDNSQALIRKIQATRELTSAPLRETSILDVMDRCIEDLERKHADVKVEVSYCDARPIVRGDNHADILLMNILENAVIHNNKAQRRVWVTIDCTDDGCEVCIADNGPGISDEKKESLFDPERRFGGVGIHQAMMIVSKYGGCLTLTDRIATDQSQGAKFIICIPSSSQRNSMKIPALLTKV